MNYHLDFETRSEADLEETGAYRYAEDDTTEILMFAIATDTEGPYLWVHPKWRSVMPSDPRADALFAQMMEDPTALIYAHNAQFERATLMYRGAKDLSLRRLPRQEQWRCTAAMGRKAALHGSLEGLAKDLNLTVQKDLEGEKLKAVFCWPNKATGRITDPTEEPEKFRRFCQYNITDVVVERDVHKKLKPFELTGLDLATFLLDVRLNDRGIPVNVPAARNAMRIVDEMLEIKVLEFNCLTGLNPTQRAKVKDLLEQNGVKMLDMKQPTLEEAIERLEEAETLTDAEQFALQVLKGYAEVNYGAAKKVHVIVRTANKDGRVRGTLLYHGAGTGRWAGRLIQPQNFKKPSKRHAKITDLIYAMICRGCTREELEFVFGNPMDAIASCIRNFIQRPDGPLLDADFASIEARIVCWLAGQLDAVEDFRKGVDQYIKLAATIFNKPADKIENPSFEREVGKRGILGCGFSMGPPKFVKSCAQYGVKLDLELAKKAVSAYRREFDKVAQLWDDCDGAVRAVLRKPSQPVTVGFLTFRSERISGISYMTLQLPSGRKLYYPDARLEKLSPDEIKGMSEKALKWREQQGTLNKITYFGEIKNGVWGRVKLYGGKIVENAVQAVAADFMSIGSQNAEKIGFVGITLIHDQNLSDPKSNDHKADLKEFIAALTDLEDWAGDCPISAEGKVAPYYKK